MLDESPHAASAVTRKGASVWQISRLALDEVRAEKPEVFYRIVGRVAARLSERLRHAAERIAGEKAGTLISTVRTEHDSLGEREVPENAYYGVQTVRGSREFPALRHPALPLRTFHPRTRLREEGRRDGQRANSACSIPPRAEAIAKACDEIIAGKLHDQFVVDMIQGGAGTSTNMNANEVIANRALELLGHRKGQYEHLHPNDHVNCSQSTNDAYPTAIKLGCRPHIARHAVRAARTARLRSTRRRRSSPTS